MRDRLISSTPLTDVNPGSVFTTMLEAAAQEDDEQYFQMLEIIRGYSLDTTSGTDLDDRAYEYGLTRLTAQTASTVVTISDTAITKVYTGVYSGLPGSPAGALYIRGDSDTGFPTSGTIIVGRNTPNAEAVPYTSISVSTNYVTFNLAAGLAFDHGTDETIILAQGGARLIPSGTVVLVPASDINPRVEFTLDDNATILDGESEVTVVPVTAGSPGSQANVPVGAIQQFDSPPFATATVTNTARVTNGRDEETDQELRDRIKSTIQSLSRGTGKSITTGILNLISSDENKRVVSASLIEPTSPANVVKLYIDDGTGFIPSFAHVGYEEIVTLATGGERYLKITNVPVMKAFVQTDNLEPYNMVGNLTLFVEVGGAVETITFQSTDFAIPAAATAQEIVKKINSTATLFEARLAAGENSVRVFARADFDEQIRVTGGTANASLNFPTDTKYTVKLYRKRENVVELLNKDGITASIESGLPAGYNMSVEKDLCVIVDGKSDNPQHITFTPGSFLSPSSVSAKNIVTVINQQLAGAYASTSSNDTRISIASNIERKSTSKIRIVENFSKIFKNSGASYTDITAAAQTSGTNTQLWSANGDRLYLGHDDVKFRSVAFMLDVVASSAMGFTAEYWNGLTWRAFGVADATGGLTASGSMVFRIPQFDWQQNAVNGYTAYWIRLTRSQPVLVTPPTESRIRICSANEAFGFSETEVVGTDRDYTLNRFIGQIELVEPLSPLDNLSIGSSETRAQVASIAGPFGMVGGESLNLEIDGVLFVIPFVAGDFFAPGTALPSEIVTKINSIIVGGVADTVDSGTKVRIYSNRWNGGTIKVAGGTANSFLQLSTDLQTAHISHYAAVESIDGPYVFGPDQTLIVIMDENGANNFSVPAHTQHTIQSATATTLVDTTLSATFPLSSDLANNFEAYIIDGAQAGQRQDILSYVPGTGTITLAAPLAGAPNPNDKFQIFPKNAVGLSSFWNNRQVTLLSVSADVSVCAGGTRIQIASEKAGELGSVQVTGGTANAALGFSTQITRGVDGYRYLTGLAQVTQWTVDGRSDDQTTYPGIRAAGVQVEVIEPVRVPIRVELDVTTREGVTLGSITNDVKSAVSSYINTLAVGADVILSEIICSVKDVSGVSDVKINSPTANVAISDSELARIVESDVVVG